MDEVTVVKFTRSAGMYRQGEEAGFNRETADAFVSRGIATITHLRTPRVAPAVAALDVKRQLDDMQAMLASVERNAKVAAKDPATAAGAAEALELAKTLQQQVAALTAQVAAGLPERLDGAKRATGAAKAA